MEWNGSYDRLYVNGEWVLPSTDETIQVISPYGEQVVARVAAGAPQDIDRAVEAARQAFDTGPWPRMSFTERAEALRPLGTRFADSSEQIAQLITGEMGCPITQSRIIQAGGLSGAVEEFLSIGAEFPFEEVRRSAGGTALVLREPVGVVAAIVPWNLPLMIALMKLVPALLTGCTVVLKPSPETPMSSYLLAEMFDELGLPPGVLNVVAAEREASERLVVHPGVDKVTFAGSTVAGRRIAALCGQDLRRTTLELGGKSAAVILDDADLDATVESLRMGSLRNNGQVCSLKTRLLVSSQRRAELVERLGGLLESMPLGDPADERTQMGPMVSQRQRERVESFISSALDQGATLVAGGGRPASQEHGWFVEPTVFTDVRPDMLIAQEEIFGPVLSVIEYRDEEDAVAIANDSTYGLNGSVFTSDPEHGLALARRMRTGTVELNGAPVGRHAPIGGYKMSGIGREFGREGLDAYTEVKSVGLPPEVASSIL